MRLQYPTSTKIIRVPCTGKVDLLHILRAFEKGADGVITSLQTLLEEETAEPPEKEKKEEKKEDYKKMYFELKRKYDELLKNLRTFTESVTKTDT